MAYTQAISQLRLIQTYGWDGVQINHDHLEPLPFIYSVFSWIKSVFAAPSPSQEIRRLAQRNIRFINQTHANINSQSAPADCQTFFNSGTFFQNWNRHVSSGMQISYTGKLPTISNTFPPTLFECYYQTEQMKPLIVSPKDTMTDFMGWATVHQQEIAAELENHGALVFRGFPLTRDNFPTAFQALIGSAPAAYPGDVPRREISPNVYYSTAVKPSHLIPLHLEASSGPRHLMPQRIAFYCETFSQHGGQTTLGDVRAITQDIQSSAPDIWRLINGKSLTYTARYLPDNSLRTKWIRMLNSSHATIGTRFGTQDWNEIQQYSHRNGLTCTRHGSWVEISRSGVPATSQINGTTLFCNGIHLGKISPGLCGGTFYYVLARALLFPSAQSAQFDVRCDDGTPISPEIATRLLSILKKHEIVLDWELNDLKLVHNRLMAHGKLPHKGPRQIFVAMA